ncbi:MAG: hypothetical protein RSB67_01025 [Clostridia bacterium]
MKNTNYKTKVNFRGMAIFEISVRIGAIARKAEELGVRFVYDNALSKTKDISFEMTGASDDVDKLVEFTKMYIDI